MRATATFAAASLLSACSTLTEDPRLTVSPYYAVYQLRGATALQSDLGGGLPPLTSPQVPLHEFGQGHHEDDFGVRAELGDGFAGLRVDYLKLDMATGRNGVLTTYWGALLQDDVVRMHTELDELRVSYVQGLGTFTTPLHDEDLTMRFGAGGEFAYRDLSMRATTDDLMRQQNLTIVGETASIAARFRATWRDVTFDVDYAISPDIVLGGDFGGVGQDLELRGAYTIPLHDITFFAGYRYSTLEADGSYRGLGYDADLRIDGFQFGMTVSL